VSLLTVDLSSSATPALITSQKYLIDAFANSKDFWTFIPSEFGVSWTQNETADIKNLADKEAVLQYAENKGVLTTVIKNRLYPELVFKIPTL